MKQLSLFGCGIVVGLCASLVAPSAAGPTAILNTAGVYVEVLTLAPGEGSGQHSIIPAEVGVVAEGKIILSSPNGREPLQAGKAF